MDDMLKDFVVEAMDLAVNVEEHLLRLERDPNNKETLNAVFRSFHSIKGGAGSMNLPALVAACTLTETLFDAPPTGPAPGAHGGVVGAEAAVVGARGVDCGKRGGGRRLPRLWRDDTQEFVAVGPHVGPQDFDQHDWLRSWTP